MRIPFTLLFLLCPAFLRPDLQAQSLDEPPSLQTDGRPGSLQTTSPDDHDNPLPLFLDDYHIRSIGPEDGLPASYARRLIHTRDGHLYASFYRGLVRLFAGYAEPVELPGFFYDGLLYMSESPDGDVWMVSQNSKVGVLRGGRSLVILDSLEHVSEPAFTSDGTVWMVGRRLVQVRLENDRAYSTEVEIPPEISVDRIVDVREVPGLGTVAIGMRRTVTVSSEGVRPLGPEYQLLSIFRRDVVSGPAGLWLATTSGLLHIGPGGSVARPEPIRHDETAWMDARAGRRIGSAMAGLLRYPEAEPLLGASGQVVDAYATSDGTLWMVVTEQPGGIHRLLRIRDGSADFIRLRRAADFRQINSMTEDHEGNIWIRTDRGLIQLAPRKILALDQAHGLRESFTTSIVQGEDGSVFVGTWGAGVHVFAEGRIVRILTTSEGLPDDRVRCLYRDRTGRIWIGTFAGAAVWDGESVQPIALPVPVEPVRAFAEDAGGTLWIASQSHVFRMDDGRPVEIMPGSFENLKIWDFEFLEDGDLLVASERGLFRAEDVEGGPARLHRLRAPDLENPSWMVMVHRLSDGSLWAGSYNDGLFRVLEDELIRLSREDGLHSNGIWAMVEDGLGNVWMPSDHGIGVLPLEALVRASHREVSLRPMVFRESEGMPSREATRSSSAATRLRDGRLLFNNISGLAVVEPERALRRDPPPGLLLSEVFLDGHPADPDPSGTFSVPAGTRRIEVTVSALSYVAPSQIAYRHRIDGFEEDWVFDGRNRAITYTNLPPGYHRLRVQARVGHGEWTSAALIVPVHIQPNFWQRGDVHAGGALFALVLAFGFVYMQRLRRRRLERLVDVRTAELRVEQEKTARQAQLLRARAAQLSRLDEMRTRFFANVSHEIRTPLTNVSLVLDHLADESTDREQRAWLDGARTNLGRLKRLSDDIVVLSRIDCGELEFRPLAGDIWAALRELVAAHAPMAEFHGVTLQTRSSLGSGEPVPAHFDRKLLDHVIGNFISNGIKFNTAGGKVQVSLDMHDTYLEIHVRDTGIGIQDNEIHHLYERFYQSEDGLARGYEGMGLGLAVVKEVSDRVRGVLRVESTPGLGSTFTIRLPRWYEEASATGGPAVSKARGDGAPSTRPTLRAAGPDPPDDRPTVSASPSYAHILLIEDNADTAALLEQALAKFSFETVTVARTVAEARLVFAEGRPELIVTDIMMPGTDGLTFLDEIRADEHLRDVPVLVVSARTGLESRVEAFERGADGFLEKPFRRREFISQVRRLLRSRASLRKSYAQRLLLGDSSREIPSAEEAFVEQARDVVLQHLSSVSVSELAYELALSPQHLRRRLKKATGMSPSRFVREMRLLEAQQLLEAGADHVQQIALRVGYRDVDTFRRHFKARFGKLPREVAPN